MEYAGIICGLGNPGRQYAGTRHNCGFMLVDLLLEQARGAGSIEELGGKKFNCLLWKVSLPSLAGTWLAAKPLTFMNDSGKSVQPLLAWYKLTSERLIVVQDELDIPPGELRFKYGGGLAGHRGLLSISNCLGTRDFYRLRIGIGKPQHKDDVLNWVLGRPAGDAASNLDHALVEGLETIFIFSRDGFKAACLYAKNASRDG